MPTFDAVQAQYDAFPYPLPSVVAQELPAGFARGILNFLTRRRTQDWLQPAMRIWVAGCGTQQASMCALAYPEAEIVATDLSDGVLDIARSLASQLRLSNIRFDQQNIAEAAFEEQFDVVVSTGVIHHMPDPVVGASALRRALKPNGAAVLMVYSQPHRAAIVPLRAAHRLLSGAGQGEDERYELANRLLDVTLDSPRCEPAARASLNGLRDMRNKDRPFVADALLHPLEHSYDVSGLFELLGAAGLRHASWLHPAVWDLSHYSSDEQLNARCEALEEAEQWQIVQALAGLRSPLLEVIAERSDSPIREPYSLDEILAMRVVRSNGVQGFGIEDNAVTKTGHIPPYAIDGQQLRGRARVSDGPGREFALPLAAREVIDAFAEQRAIGEVLDTLSSSRPRDELLELVAHLLPCDIGLLSPLHPG